MPSSVHLFPLLLTTEVALAACRAASKSSIAKNNMTRKSTSKTHFNLEEESVMLNPKTWRRIEMYNQCAAMKVTEARPEVNVIVTISACQTTTNPRALKAVHPMDSTSPTEVELGRHICNELESANCIVIQ